MPDTENIETTGNTNPPPKRSRISIWSLLLMLAAAVFVIFQAASQFDLWPGGSGSSVRSSLSNADDANAADLLLIDFQVKYAYATAAFERAFTPAQAQSALHLELVNATASLESLLQKHPSDQSVARRLMLIRAEADIEPLAGVSADRDNDAVPPPLNAFDSADPAQRSDALMWRKLFSRSRLASGVDPAALKIQIESDAGLQWYRLLALHQLGLRSGNSKLASDSFAEALTSARNWIVPREITLFVVSIFYLSPFILLFPLLLSRILKRSLPLSLKFLDDFAARPPAVENPGESVMGAGELFNLFAVCLAFFVAISYGIRKLASQIPLSALLANQRADILSLCVSAAEALSTLFALFLLAVYFRKKKASLSSEIGLAFALPKSSAGFAWLAWGAAQPVILIASELAQKSFSHVPNPENPALSLITASSSLGVKILLYLTVCVFAPIFEEIMFRGLLYQCLRRKIGVRGSIFASGVFFGLLHPVSIIGSVPLMALGMIFAWMAETKKSLLPSMFAHSIQNTIAFIEMLALGS